MATRPRSKPSRHKRRLARERIARAKEHELPAAALPSVGRGSAKTAATSSAGAGRTRGEFGAKGDATEATGEGSGTSSVRTSSGPRPTLWRRLPGGAQLTVLLALGVALAGAVIAVLRSGSEGSAAEPKVAQDRATVSASKAAPDEAAPSTPEPSAESGSPSPADVVPAPEGDAGSKAVEAEVPARPAAGATPGTQSAAKGAVSALTQARAPATVAKPAGASAGWRPSTAAPVASTEPAAPRVPVAPKVGAVGSPSQAPANPY